VRNDFITGGGLGPHRIPFLKLGGRMKRTRECSYGAFKVWAATQRDAGRA
jgi:hypothetical protein